MLKFWFIYSKHLSTFDCLVVFTRRLYEVLCFQISAVITSNLVLPLLITNSVGTSVGPLISI